MHDVAIFCLRLAPGLLAALWVLGPTPVNPRFFRTHFLTALGLTALAAVATRDVEGTAYWVALGLGMALCFLGSVSYSLEEAPLGRALVVVTPPCLAAALGLTVHALAPDEPLGWRLVSEGTSAALLGVATTAMLMGHNYLIAPTLSITPLVRLLVGLFVATGLRTVVAGAGLWLWSAEHSLARLDFVTLLLPLRWGLGLVGPVALGILAWQTAKIRSTQSATGILYVVVIFCFLGELTSLLLLRETHLPL